MTSVSFCSPSPGVSHIFTFLTSELNSLLTNCFSVLCLTLVFKKAYFLCMIFPLCIDLIIECYNIVEHNFIS